MFGHNFVSIKSKYSIELIPIDIKISEYNTNKVKSVLLNNTISVRENLPSSNSFIIEVPKSIFFKAVLSEFEQYHVRSLLQLSDFEKMDDKINNSWKFTTYYYFFFFSNVSLHRYLQKGYIYLDTESSVLLSNLFSAILPDPVTIGKGHWYFEKVNDSSSNVEIKLTKMGGNIHQLGWQTFKKTLKDFKLESDKRNNAEENSVLVNLYNILKSNNKFSPSDIRNYLNYFSEISIAEIENKVLCPKLNIDDFLKNLSKYDYNNSNLSQIKLSILLGQYIHCFNTAIIEDLEQRNSKIFKLRKKYIKQMK